MGCLFSCCGEGEEEGNEGERTRLLSEHNSNIQVPDHLKDDLGLCNPGLSNNVDTENDESSILTRILDDLSLSVIDISVLNSHHVGLEQHEIRERQNAYIKLLDKVGVELVSNHANITTDIELATSETNEERKIEEEIETSGEDNKPVVNIGLNPENAVEDLVAELGEIM